MNRPTNQYIINKYLNYYKHSIQSVRMRESCLKHFFFGSFSIYRHIFDVKTNDLIDYFEHLNHLENISLTTKKNKWHILLSFLNFTMEYFMEHKFIVIIPKTTIKWQKNHKKPNSNKNVIATLEEIQTILSYLKLNNYKHYVIFRMLIETGMRLGEGLNAKLKNIDIRKRLITVIGKTGEKTYYFSENFAKILNLYLNERSKLKEINSNALFLNNNLRKYSNRTIQQLINNILKKLGIDKQITPQTFRRTLNTLRKKRGCDNDTAKILLGHKLRDVNIESYTIYNYEDYIEMFDRFNPYTNLKI